MAEGLAVAPVSTGEAEQVALAKRDRQAFAPLYLRYFQPIYGYCHRRLGSADDAADAASQVFARALAALPSCRDETFRSWLFAIAHNVLTDHVRARRPVYPLDEANDLPDGQPTPEDLAVAADAMASMHRLLQHLLPDQRQIIELRLAGLTSKEIAEVLGRTSNAVDQAQFRAMNRLRALMEIVPLATERRP